MKVATWQAPLGPCEPAAVVERLRLQVERCEAEGVEVLCCPEAVLGGLADGSPDPDRHALDDEALLAWLAPARSPSVTMIVGYTERDRGPRYNTAAIVLAGEILGRYRKVYPGDRSAYDPGDTLPVFAIGPSCAPCGIAICNDVQYVEPARVLAARGAAILFVPTWGAHHPEKYARLRARGNHLLVARAVDNSSQRPPVALGQAAWRAHNPRSAPPRRAARPPADAARRTRTSRVPAHFNRLTVVAADVGGRHHGRVSEGITAVVDRDGTVLAKARPYDEDLLIVDVPAARPPPDPRGWDGARNPAVTRAFLELWDDPGR